MKKYLIILLFSCQASAVYINQQGIGEVLLIPYYTVNNNLNSLVTVTNTSDTSKAVKINVREGLNGYAVLSYNVYLDAYDSWSFGFVPSTSTVTGYVGQGSVKQYTSDHSCAPFLVKNGQEFLPYELIDGPVGMERSREGFIEIIEMGELQDEFIDYADQGNFGTPSDCSAFEAAWLPGGAWDADTGGAVTQHMVPASGDLMAEANLVNVAEGIDFSIPVVAMSGFFNTESVAHFNPGDTSLSLDAAAPYATVFANEKSYQLGFETGIDAVSAVLMVDELIANYVLDTIVAGKTEAVFSQPARRFYVSEQGNNNLPPYNAMNHPRLFCPTETNTNELSQYGGTTVNWLLSDRESQLEVLNLVLDPPPPRYVPALCDSVSVWQLLLPGQFGVTPGITASSYDLSIATPARAVTENGFIKINFLDTRPLVGSDLNNNTHVEMMGIPIIGFTLQQFSNASAGPGLLAQYGSSKRMKPKLRLVEQGLPLQ